MNESERQKRIEYEDLAARALEGGLDDGEMRRFHEILDHNPKFDEEWNRILNTALLVRSSDLKIDDFPLPQKQRSHTISLFFPDRFHINTGFAWATMAATLILLILPFAWFRMENVLDRGLNPSIQIVATEGLCYGKEGHLKPGSATPHIIAAGNGSICRLKLSYEKSVNAELHGPGNLKLETSPSNIVIHLNSGKLQIVSHTIHKGGKLSVIASGIRISALGTTFQVFVGEGGFLEVKVSEGEVRLNPSTEKSDAQGITVKNGKEWSGKREGTSLRGKIRNLVNLPTKHRPNGEVPLLQSVITRDGKSYTGTIRQEDSLYQITTVHGTISVPKIDVERIEILLPEEQDTNSTDTN